MITKEKIKKLLRSPLFYILLGSGLLFLLGINWGLPNKDTWQSDSLAPFYPLLALSKGFSGGYFHKYPLVHQFILAVFYLPVVIVSFINSSPLEGLQILEFLALLRTPAYATTLIIIARLVSVAMGVIMIYVIYLSGRELFNEKAGLFAALIVALNPVINANAHVAKVDLPFLFWAVLSLYFLIKAIKYDKSKDYIKCALFACFSFGTKDQGYAIFILPFFVYLFILPLIKRGNASIIKTIFRKKILLFSGAFIAGTVLVENIIGNYSGLIKRFAMLTGDNGTRSIGYTLDAAGIFRLFLDSTIELAHNTMGIPLFLIAVTGIVLLIYKARKNKEDLLLKLVFVLASLSFYLFFVQIIRQNNARFVLPQSVFLAIYGGYAIATILDSLRIYRKLVLSLLIASFIYTFYLAISINMNFLLDSRYTAEKWMRDHIPAGSVIEYYSYLHYLPRFPENTVSYRIKENVLDIEKRAPGYIVLSSHYYTRYKVRLKHLGSGQKEKMKSQRFTTSSFPLFFYNLFSNKLNYRLVYKHTDKFSFFKKIKFSKVSPEQVLVFKRVIVKDHKKLTLNPRQAMNMLSAFTMKKMKASLALVSDGRPSPWDNPDFVSVAFPKGNSKGAQFNSEQRKSKNLYFYSFMFCNKIAKDNLKQTFFQALSNSAWAHEAYLAAVDIDLTAPDYYELRNLSVRFGIGVIIINPEAPEISEIILPAKKQPDLQWDSFELLQNNNNKFKKFTEQVETNIQNYTSNEKK